MKKMLIPLAASALLLASCDTSTKDSYRTIPYYEYNLIVDNVDPSVPAATSYATYEVKFNISKYCVDVKGSDLIFNNQKYSFETDTMALRQKPYTIDGQTAYNLTFSKSGNAGASGTGSSASNLQGTFVYCYIPQSNDILNPTFELGANERLDMSYTLNDRYSVQTFWPAAYYKGQTVATDDGESHSTNDTGYLTQIDFEKKTASVYVYNAKFSANEEKPLPKVMLFEGIPLVFSHDGFSLEAAAPKTTVLGVKNNLPALVDSVGFGATDFSMVMTSKDLTEVWMTYKLNGKQVNFRGCSIIK